MVNVIFKKVSATDSMEYVFQDSSGVEYFLYSDKRGEKVRGLTPDFWDKFFFLKSINVDYINENGKKDIVRIGLYR